MSFLQTAALVGSLAASVSAHGYVQGIVAGGTYYTGYSPSFQYQSPPPTVIGWSDPEDLSNGYIAPSNYSTQNIICHLDATPAGTSAKIAAGDKVELEWTTWPDSHHGPVITYLAKCPAKCEDVDKTTLEFFKIDEGGLIDGSSSPGNWASDTLIANNNSWTVTIPTSIAAGNYVLRHEIIALHSAGEADGAQNYPQCINLEITSDGSDTPAGTLGTALYKEDDPGILINIYTSLSTYTIPGPTLYTGAASGASQTGAASSNATSAAGTGASSSYVPASTTATSAPAQSSYAAAAATTSPAAAAAQTTTPEAKQASASLSASVSLTTYTDASGATVTSECTTTIIATVTASVSASPETSSPAAQYNNVASTTTPSSIIASATSSAASAASSSDADAWGSKPEKSLPEGWTLKDLLQWVSYLLKKGWSSEDGAASKRGLVERKHVRDFSRVNALPYDAEME